MLQSLHVRDRAKNDVYVIAELNGQRRAWYYGLYGTTLSYSRYSVCWSKLCVTRVVWLLIITLV